MGGGHFREGLPHPHPLTSYWQTPFSEIANHRSTPDLPEVADYVVVGTGISGASIATKLLNTVPSAKIVLLEARTVCSGATGRNGGHCSPGIWTAFFSVVEDYGETEALKYEKFELDNVENVAAFIRNNGIDCDLDEVERVDMTVNEDEWKQAVEVLRKRDKLLSVSKPHDVEDPRDGVEIIGDKKVFSGKAATEFLHMPDIAGAVAYRGYTLSPYKLVNEMVRRLLRQGVNLQTTTPVLSVSRQPAQMEAASSHPWIVETERGCIRAKEVILATNAYTGALHKPLATSKFLIPTRGQAVAIRPGSKVAHDPIIHKGLGLNGHGLQDYSMQRPVGSSGAGDIIYGGGRRLSKTGEQFTLDDSTLNAEIAKYLPNAPASFYSRDVWGENGRTIMAWTGIMGYTEDGRGIVGEVKGKENRGLWLSIGWNGHGMATTFQAAQALVDMITTGKKPDWFPEALSSDRIPSR